jgi:hypothetical protein
LTRSRLDAIKSDNKGKESDSSGSATKRIRKRRSSFFPTSFDEEPPEDPHPSSNGGGTNKPSESRSIILKQRPTIDYLRRKDFLERIEMSFVLIFFESCWRLRHEFEDQEWKLDIRFLLSKYVISKITTTFPKYRPPSLVYTGDPMLRATNEQIHQALQKL